MFSRGKRAQRKSITVNVAEQQFKGDLAPIMEIPGN